ncbi:hypothetical protein D3C71_1290100 [compost metagenome]
MIIVELATEVYFKEPIQSKKCRASIVPESTSMIQSFLRRANAAPLYGLAKGNISSEVNNSRYIPCIDAGAADHLIKKAEKEMATIPISIKIGIGSGGFLSFTWYASFHYLKSLMLI